MTSKIRVGVVWGVLVAAIGLLSPPEAGAQGVSPYSPVYYYYPVYPQGLDRSLPYYAAHPPVYYSHVVARPYGYSPFAYYPGIVTPGFELLGRRHLGRPCDIVPDGSGVESYEPPVKEEAGNPQPEPDRQADARPEAPRPVVLANHYALGGSDQAPPVGSASSGPVRITNPYVVMPQESQAVDATAIAAD
jgi:hypothetical protein